MNRINILSGDLRQTYLWKYMRKQNFDAHLVSNLNFERKDMIVCGTPFAKLNDYLNCDFYTSYPIETFIQLLHPGQLVFAGGISGKYRKMFQEKEIIALDLLQDRHLIWQNAHLTAEALLGKIITTTVFSLRHSNVFVFGFGTCGMNIARLMKQMDCNLFIVDHTPENLSRATSFGYQTTLTVQLRHLLKEADIIINTVPQPILKPEHYALLKKSCVLYEIASYPYGLDHALAEEYSLSFYTCPGLPGKYTPQAAGELIAKQIISHLERMN